MSYILDALRKSEAERARGEAPSLLTTTDPHRVVPRYMIWLLLAVLSVNALLLALWLMPIPLPESRETTTPSQAPAPLSGQTTTTVAEDRDVAAPAQAATAALPASASPARVIPPPADSPTAVTIPQIEFSTHVYSEDPDLRAVTVGGRRFSEGEDLQPGVRLVEITETGVVIESGGLRTEIDVLQDWR